MYHSLSVTAARFGATAGDRETWSPTASNMENSEWRLHYGLDRRPHAKTHLLRLLSENDAHGGTMHLEN